jgi:aspartyl/asparaginyl-tRNA synthetase
MRVRSALAFATHLFFQTAGFQYLHTPIISAADCEGAGELFQVNPQAPTDSPMFAGKSGIRSLICQNCKRHDSLTECSNELSEGLLVGR